MSEYVPQPWRMEGYYPDQYAKTSASLDFALDYDDETFDRHEREFLADLNAYAAEQQVLALREAAETFARTVGEPAHPGRSVVCLDMKTGVVTDVQTWLRDRAARIEAGEDA